MSRAATTVLPLILSGCSILSPPAIIENRFARQDRINNNIVPHISIAVSSAAPEGEGGGVAITELSDRGQAALIDQMKGHPPIQLKKDKKPGSLVETHDTIERRLIVTLRPDNFLPEGDRVSAVRISLQLAPSSPWRITSWNLASDGDDSIEVGKLTGVTERKISASTGIKALDALPNATISAEAGRTDTRELDIQDSKSFSAAVDASGTAWLDKTAGWRVNLARNLSIDVVATATSSLSALPTFSFNALTIGEGADKDKPSRPKDVRLQQAMTLSPLGDQRLPVCGLATIHYRIRHIANEASRRSYSEADDVIQYVDGDDVDKPFLFSSPAIEVRYEIRARGRPLNYQLRDARPVAVLFSSLEDAVAFRDWLREAAPAGGRIADGSETLGTNPSGQFTPLSSADYADLLAQPLNADLANQANSPWNATCPPLPSPAPRRG